MTNEIIRRRAKLIGPSDSTKSLILEKNSNQLDNIQKSGLTNLNQTIKQLTSTQIPNIVEGVVIGYINEDKRVKYKLISDNASLSANNGEIEGYCIIVRTPLDIGTKTDPENLLASLNESKTEEEKTEIRLKIVNAILEHDVVAAASEDERLPKIGEHVTVTYYNSLCDSGESIKGFYETVKNNNSYYENPPEEFLNFYNSPINKTNQNVNIIPDSEDDVPGVVDYLKSIFGIEEQKPSANTEIRPLNQADRRWGAIPLGNSNIQNIGCCLTSYTMAYNYLLNPSSELTPDKSIDIAKRSRSIDSRGWIIHSSLAQALNMSFVDEIKNTNNNNLRNFIESGLNSGDALLFHVDWKEGIEGDHWIMCYKKDDSGNYFCNDPSGGKTISIDKETLTAKFIAQGKQQEYRLRRIIRVRR